MISIVDQILDIATQFPREEAHVLLTELLFTGVQQAPPRLVDKTPGKAVVITDLNLTPHGSFTDPQGRRATVYKSPMIREVIDGPPPTQPNRNPNPTQMDAIDKMRKEMNDLSKAIVDKTMGKT